MSDSSGPGPRLTRREEALDIDTASETGRPRQPTDPLEAIRGARVLSGERGASRAPEATGPREPAGGTTEQPTEDLQPLPRTRPGPGHESRPNRATQQIQSPALGTRAPAERNAGEGGARRRNMILSRVLPLAALVGLALAAIVLVTLGVIEEGAQASSESGSLTGEETSLLGDIVTLPPVEATIGLSADNREAVLAACFRLSDNANHECRVSHLRELGEYPARTISFPALRFHLREVSNAEYEACVEAGECPPRDWDACRFHTVRGLELNQRVPESMRAPARPAVCVNAEEALAFCRASGMRLPTADEWERGARGGDDRLQPWGSFWAPALLNWGERDMGGFPVPGRLDGADLTASVFDYADGASPDGLLNMMGNAAEWVVNPDDPETPFGSRGGSYVDDLRTLRLTRTVPLQGTERRSTLGFRCVAGVAAD